MINAYSMTFQPINDQEYDIPIFLLKFFKPFVAPLGQFKIKPTSAKCVMFAGYGAKIISDNLSHADIITTTSIATGPYHEREILHGM